MKKLLTILLIPALSVMAAEEPRPDVQIDDVDTMELSSPLYQDEGEGVDTIQVNGLSLTQYRGKPWFRIAVEYETRPEWIDLLTLEFYVLMPGPEKEKNLFKGVVRYVDISQGRKHLAEMYMHFNSYERFRGRGEIKTAVLAKIDGEIISIDKGNSLDDPWWENIPARPHGLLNRLLTPFSVINPQNYEAQYLRPRD